MNVCSTVSPTYAKCEKAFNTNQESLQESNRDCKDRPGPGYVTTHSQKPREDSFSATPDSNPASRSCQRRWSIDFSSENTSVIIVRKSKKEPQPPQRSVSLLQPNTASDRSLKRYSCPPIGFFGSLSRPSSSSSASSSSSSLSTSSCPCCSPPPVPTSVITGPDPFGWKLHPKSRSSSSRARTKRLSLQISLPVITPELKTSPAPNPQSDNAPSPDPTPKTKPPFRPKPPRRRHSDSAFIRSPANPLPVVTLDELCSVHLHPVTLSHESDDVFSTGMEEKVKATPRPHKIPPPVPEKTVMARQIAQLIALSHRRCKANEENIYSSVLKPNPQHSRQAEDHSRLRERHAGLPVDTSHDRERSTPRFPG
uniref:uncharacterized serine-rich protein C215.13-like isoform X2 n=1 Tax=Scatophagus argus TaxID=75038 RepID=UPI001ED7FF7B|nr:uncharacterized serine-rich protein C215.13-like isoform X2 [Scatophagus argus]